MMPKYICKVLPEGSIDASYDGNTSILNEVLKYIESTKRLNTFQKLLKPQPIIVLKYFRWTNEYTPCWVQWGICTQRMEKIIL